MLGLLQQQSDTLKHPHMSLQFQQYLLQRLHQVAGGGTTSQAQLRPQPTGSVLNPVLAQAQQIQNMQALLRGNNTNSSQAPPLLSHQQLQKQNGSPYVDHPDQVQVQVPAGNVTQAYNINGKQ